MTEGQLLLVLGTIWAAPHTNEWFGKFMSCIFLIVAACKGLGWI